MRFRFASLAVLALAATIGLAACGEEETPPPAEGEGKTYTVTFVQSGQEDVVKTVSEGGTLTDIPTPKDRTGYTVGWDVSDYSDVRADFTVHAVETPNDYTITYVADHGSLQSNTQTVTYDANYTLAVPTETGDYTFSYWKRADGTGIAQKGVWKIAENVTLTAVYADPLTVTFIQTGCAPVVKTVVEGGTLTDIPRPQAKTGYTVVWESADFTNITKSFTVNAMETPNNYTITYDLGTLANDRYATISSKTQTVTFDTTFNLYTPSCYGYTFVKWVITGTDTAVTNGTWDRDDHLPLTAVWEKDESSDRWAWTKFY
ncbi:MAG: InlB B-repeat-containing protein [Candidatus Gallimonas sp.]